MDNIGKREGFIERRDHAMRAAVDEAIYRMENIGLRAAGELLDAFDVPEHVIWRVFIQSSHNNPLDHLQ